MRPRTYLLVTLGCFRNEVDSDVLRSALDELGLQETPRIDSAGIVVVNTCGFIADACAEGIDTVLEIDDLTRDLEPRPPILILGCMGQRYSGELMEQLPEVSGVLGVDWVEGLEKAVTTLLDGGRHLEVGDPRMASRTRTVDSSDCATLLVRVADGCDRGCRFCSIPSIKGRYQSRPPQEICREIERLCVEKQREVVLLAQDLTSYGVDLSGECDLPQLVRRVSRLDQVRWVRLLYLQPEGVTDELIKEITGNPAVCDYFDIPFQHASKSVLKAMGRPGDAERYRKLVSSIRERSPEASMRTTVMVGYPGETESDFQDLLSFIEEVRFDWLGAFRFSAEEGTPAASLPREIGREAAVSRYNTILEIQDSIEESESAHLLGRELEVVVDGISHLVEYDLVGRSYREAPVVDGVIFLKDVTGCARGATSSQFVRATIVGQEGLDLVGEI